MAILNYTTKVGVDKTVNEIHKILTKSGANAILNEYDKAREIEAISFRVTTPQGEIYFKLPANVGGVEKALRKDKQFRDEKHTRRVAWRILKDWIEAQMAIIEAQMADLAQVFLPYAKTSNGETVYERMISDGGKFLAITQQ